ncbi:MAG TPA: ABC transporter substrate-binding protein [Burkholderiaceae bacterium]
MFNFTLRNLARLLTPTLCLFLSFSVAATEIRVSVLLAPQQRSPYDDEFQRFTQETGIKVVTIPRHDSDYKADMSSWLLGGTKAPDVMFWQASHRLTKFAESGAIRPITQLWNEQNLDRAFAQVKAGVTYKGDVYGLPISYYQWGLYYKKSLIEKFGGAPRNWEEFVAQCERLKRAGITPLGIGTAGSWPVAAWFDYLDLRINGLPFHMQLLNGKVSFRDLRTQQVLIEWKKLIDGKYFNADNRALNWDEVLPWLYRDRIAYTLIGAFVVTRLPHEIEGEFAFMPFPEIKNIPLYEEAPMDILIISKNTSKPREAEAFLKFMSRADTQAKLNTALGLLSPNREAAAGQSEFIRAGVELFARAKGVSQYFDRDTAPEFEKRAMPILVEFLNNGNIRLATEKLEKARFDVFPQ